MFEGGSIVARIQLVGAAAATGDLRGLDAAFAETAAAANTAGVATDRADDANQRVGRSARTATTAVSGQAAAQTTSASASERAAVATAGTATAADSAAAATTSQTAATTAATAASTANARQETVSAEQRRTAQMNIAAGVALTGVAVASFGVLAVREYANFDKAMSEVNATIQGSVQVQNQLRDAAIKAGAATSFSATEAAQAENELAKAGVATSSILNGGLAGALSLAAAGQLSVADAASIAATAMVQFNLKGSEVPHVADLLAAGAGKAQGSVHDLSEALNQGGLVASQMGLSVDETTGTLAAFASAGLLGSDAGTSFKTALLALANPSSTATAALQKYNIQAYDTNGNMVSMANLAGQLQTKLGKLSQAERDKALATIFGSDAIRAANVLYTNGASGIQSWTDKVNDSGYAARQASQLQNNLAGDVEKLGGSFSSALIESGGAANDMLREMVQALTYLVNAFGQLNPATLKTVGLISLVGGGILLVTGAIIAGITKFGEFKAALTAVGIATELTRGKMLLMSIAAVGVGTALALGAIILGQFIQQQAKAAAQVDAFQQSLDQQTGSMTEYTKELVVQNLNAKDSFLWMQSDSPLEAARKLGLSLDTVTKAAQGNADAYREIQQANKNFNAQAYQVGDKDKINQWTTVTNAIDDQRKKLSEAGEAQRNQSDASAKADQQNATTTESYNDASDAIQSVNNQLDTLIANILKANGVNQDAVAANESLIEATQGLADQIEKNAKGTDKAAKSWDSNTVAGAKNQSLLSSWAKTSQSAAKAALDAGGSVDGFKQSLDNGRQTLIDNAQKLGANADQARAFADQVYSIPSAKEFTMIANTSEASQNVEGFIRRYNGRRINLIVQTSGTSAAPVAGIAGLGNVANAHGNILRFADGGQYRESHLAMRVAGGTPRVWAEPETGGEAYIPMSPNKRGRSMQLLNEVATEFGYSLVRSGQQGTPSSAVSGSAGTMAGMRISGTLDLGNGLTGLIEGVVDSALTVEADKAKAGTR